MNLKSIFFLGISLTLLFNIAQGQEKLTVDDAVKIALENNYGIIISRNEVLIDENNISRGNAGFLPRVDLNVAQNYSLNDTRQQFITGTSEKDNAKSEAFNAAAVMRWTVFDGTAMFKNYDQLKLFSESSALEAQFTIENTVAGVLEIYYQIVSLEQNIAAIEEALVYSETIRNLAQQKKDIGVASGLEVLQAEVIFNADRAALLDQQERLKNAHVRLNQLLVLPLDQVHDVADTLVVNPTLDYATLVQQALDQNTNVLLSRKNFQLANLDLALIKTEQLPVVDLNLSYNFTNSSAESGFLLANQTRGWNYGISATFNLFNGFNVNRRKENARILIENAQLTEASVRNDLQADLLVAFNTYQNNIKKLELELSNLEAVRRTLDISMERNRLGDIAGIELREVQQNYLFAQNRVITSQYLAKVAEIELLRLSGQLVQTQ